MSMAVLHRELKAQSRHWAGYVFRFLAGLAGVAVICGFAALLSMPFGTLYASRPAALGAGLFSALHIACCLTLGIFCPLLTADCLSKERREGTLGLLFLTPLTAGGIVAGKAAGQIVRAFGLWLAFVPMLMVPLLLGGLTVADFLRAISVEAVVVTLALSGGLIASAICRRWVFSAVVTVVILAFLAGMMAAVCDAAFWAVALWNDPTLLSKSSSGVFSGSGIGPLALLLFTPVGVNAATGIPVSGTAGGPPAWVLTARNAAVAAEMLMTAGIAWLAFRFARRRILMEWKPEGRTVAAAERSAKWTRPVISTAWLKRRHAALLDRSPIRWLTMRTPSARLSLWILPACALSGWLLLALIFATGDGLSIRELTGFALMLAFLPIPLLVLFSAGSWRQEIEEGTLELFLVTPLPPERLVLDRARSLWLAFGPTLAFLLLMPLPFILSDNSSYYSYQRNWGTYASVVSIVAGATFALPFCGIRCAFRRLNPIAGSVLSALIAFGLPAILASMLTGVLWGFFNLGQQSEAIWFTCFALFQIGVGVAWWKLCIHDLSTRGFMLKPFQRAAVAARKSA